MTYSISDDRLYKMVDKYMTSIYGELVLGTQNELSFKIWGEGIYGPPMSEGDNIFSPFEINNFGTLWNNMGSESPHFVLGDLFGIDADELLMFYLERKFNLGIRNIEHEDIIGGY